MKKHMLVTVLLLVSAAVSTSVSWAAVRVTFPDEFPGFPGYARTDLPPLLPDTAEWAPIVFQRDPGCVPESFNLMEVLDFPAAWECPLTVAGFYLSADGGPSMDQPPFFGKTHGLGAVPVWFVSWPALREEIADGVLTITELKAMPSLLIGSATFFEEAVLGTGAAHHPNYQAVARGQLQDGRSFDYQVAVTEQDHPEFVGDRIVTIRIEFK